LDNSTNNERKLLCRLVRMLSPLHRGNIWDSGVEPQIIEKIEAFTLTTDRYKGTTQEETEKNINEARLKHFMTETVNGKSTQRVLDDFHMEATHLDHRGKDFYIAVRPKRQGFADNLKDVSFAVNSGL